MVGNRAHAASELGFALAASHVFIERMLPNSGWGAPEYLHCDNATRSRMGCVYVQKTNGHII